MVSHVEKRTAVRRRFPLRTGCGRPSRASPDRLRARARRVTEEVLECFGRSARAPAVGCRARTLRSGSHACQAGGPPVSAGGWPHRSRQYSGGWKEIAGIIRGQVREG